MGMRSSSRKRSSSTNTKSKRLTRRQACWGHHLIVNAADCIPEAIQSKSIIAAFTKELVKKIDMVAYGKPLIVHFGEGNKLGYSLVQLIETSNITGHFVEESNDMYLDIFSCKSFLEKDALEVIIQYFKPAKIHYTMLHRKAPRI
jgi:S-adenosylmethionine/arginine decarboxylase-like enzyme